MFSVVLIRYWSPTSVLADELWKWRQEFVYLLQADFATQHLFKKTIEINWFFTFSFANFHLIRRREVESGFLMETFYWRRSNRVTLCWRLSELLLNTFFRGLLETFFWRCSSGETFLVYKWPSVWTISDAERSPSTSLFETHWRIGDCSAERSLTPSIMSTVHQTLAEQCQRLIWPTHELLNRWNQ